MKKYYKIDELKNFKKEFQSYDNIKLHLEDGTYSNYSDYGIHGIEYLKCQVYEGMAISISDEHKGVINVFEDGTCKRFYYGTERDKPKVIGFEIEVIEE